VSITGVVPECDLRTQAIADLALRAARFHRWVVDSDSYKVVRRPSIAEPLPAIADHQESFLRLMM